MAIKHKRAGTHADGVDDGRVQPSWWNDEHVIDGILGLLLSVGATPGYAPFILEDGTGGNYRLTAEARAMLATSPLSVPTPPLGTNTDQVATMAAVKAAVDNLLGSSSAALRTLQDFAAYLASNPNFAASTSDALAKRVRVDVAQSLSTPQQALARLNIALDQVNNTADVDKPVSTAQATALAGKIVGPSSATDGVPALFDGSTGKLLKQTTFAALKTALSLAKSDVGLSSVDNTSDTNKPISTAQAAALAIRLRVDDDQGLSSTQKAIGRVNLGISNVNDTADADKPISTAQASAIAARASISASLSDMNITAARLNLKVTRTLNEKDYAVDLTGNTLSDAGVLAALTALPDGARLEVPKGEIVLSQGFVLSRPTQLVGEGPGTVFSLAGNFGNNNDLFTVRPPTNTLARGFLFKDFAIRSQNADNTGHSIILFDTRAGFSTSIAEVLVENVRDDLRYQKAGCYSIQANNGNAQNNGVGGAGATGAANGGLFNATIQHSTLCGGISLIYCGDTIRVLFNLLPGLNASVYLLQGGQVYSGTLYPSAGNFLMLGNNCSGAAGSLVIDQAIAPIIAFNEMEQQVVNTGLNNAIVDLRGGATAVRGGMLLGNMIQANSGTGSPTPIRFDNTLDCGFDLNTIGVPTPYPPFLITANSQNTLRGLGNSISGPAGTDLSTSTRYPLIDVGSGAWTAYAPNPFAASGTITGDGRYRMIGAKTCQVNVTVTLGAGVTGAMRFYLPFLSKGALCIAGMEVALAGVAANAYSNGSAIAPTVLRYDGNPLTTSGMQIVFQGTYEIN